MLKCWEPQFFDGLLMLHSQFEVWKPKLILLQLTSSVLIALFYYSISILLVYFISQRRALPYAGIFMMFGAFTVASGTIHLMDAFALWHPKSWQAEGIDSFRAAISLSTALLGALLLPKVVARTRNNTPIDATNQVLTEEIPLSDSVSASGESNCAERTAACSDRQVAKEILVESKKARNLPPFQVNQIKAELEQQLNERTAVLQRDNERLKSAIDGQKRCSEELYLLQSLTQVISEAPDFHSAICVALCRVCEVTNWNYGEAWLPRLDNTVLECSPAWFGNTTTLEPFRQAREKLTFLPNTGLPGRVWTSRQPEWIEDITAQLDASFVCEQEQAAGLKASFGVPILIGEQVLAVLTFFIAESSAADERWSELVTVVATQLGLVIQRKQLEEELRKSEERYRAIVEEQPELICRFLSDGTLTFVNDAYCRYFGKTREELLGSSFFQLIPDEYREKTQRHIATLSRKNQVATREYRLVMPNGDTHWQQWTDRVIVGKEGQPPEVVSSQLSVVSSKKQQTTDNGQRTIDRIQVTEADSFQLVEFQSVGRDITERRLSQQESARLASIALLSPNPIVETDLAGHVRYLNPEAMRLLPDLQDTTAQHPFLAEVPSLAAVLERQGSLRREVKIGEIYYEQVLHYIQEIQCLRIYAFDITERKRAEEQLIYNAFYDQLTGLPNRALFMDRLRQAARRAKQKDNSPGQPYRLAVLFLNLNRFKVVNDGLGNQIGDQLLQDFARRLQTCLRPTDTLARLGGDEFAILVEGIQEVSEATRVADSIHQTLSSPFYLNESEVFMTLSIGIALNTISDDSSFTAVAPSGKSARRVSVSEPGKGSAQAPPLAKQGEVQKERVLQPEDMLRNASIAMYRAKAQGKGCYEVFDATMHELVVDRLQLETDLRRAIERQEFRVYYQPIVSLSTGRIRGFEALIRWQHPQRGFVSPNEFIPTAEETGLITPIDWWTLREACCQLKVWQEQFPASQPLMMNVNLSCKQFTQPDLLQQIDKILQETEPAVGSLKLEITESLVMENLDLVKALLLELKKRKIHLCIDDFGTGYSSLSRLHHFPISTLKIDRSFVSRIGALGENSEIIRAIVTLAQTFNMDVVAEGIEVPEQISPLIALKCEYGQGNFFSKPVDSEAATALLIAQWQQQGMNMA